MYTFPPICDFSHGSTVCRTCGTHWINAINSICPGPPQGVQPRKVPTYCVAGIPASTRIPTQIAHLQPYRTRPPTAQPAQTYYDIARAWPHLLRTVPMNYLIFTCE